MWGFVVLEWVEVLDEVLCWSGFVSLWGLVLKVLVMSVGNGIWKMFLVCVVLVLLVWVVGLNLYVG